MNTVLTALLEGCLPEEFSLKHCRHCGAVFELGAECHETLCRECKRKAQSKVEKLLEGVQGKEIKH